MVDWSAGAGLEEGSIITVGYCLLVDELMYELLSGKELPSIALGSSQAGRAVGLLMDEVG